MLLSLSISRSNLLSIPLQIKKQEEDSCRIAGEMEIDAQQGIHPSICKETF
jgi:hypothetical protein